MKNLQRNTFGLIAIVYCLGLVYQLFLVTHFQLNREEITEIHCVNKDKPEMHCNGKCHLKKELEITSSYSDKVDEESNSFSPSLFFVPFSQSLMYVQPAVTAKQKTNSTTYVNSKLKTTVLDISLPPPQDIY